MLKKILKHMEWIDKNDKLDLEEIFIDLTIFSAVIIGIIIVYSMVCDV